MRQTWKPPFRNSRIGCCDKIDKEALCIQDCGCSCSWRGSSPSFLETAVQAYPLEKLEQFRLWDYIIYSPGKRKPTLVYFPSELRTSMLNLLEPGNVIHWPPRKCEWPHWAIVKTLCFSQHPSNIFQLCSVSLQARFLQFLWCSSRKKQLCASLSKHLMPFWNIFLKSCFANSGL